MSNFVIYFFPFVMDIVVAMLLFVGRHSLAMAGASPEVVGSIPLFYGLGYFLAGPVMRIIIRREIAKIQMLGAIAAITAFSLMLAGTESIWAIRLLFFVIPVSMSLFFNAFQAFMLGHSGGIDRPLGVTICLYTFAWSLGFALGPFVSGLLGDYLSWAQMYVVAAGFTLFTGVAVALFNPGATGQAAEKPSASPRNSLPLLYVPGWMGMLTGLIGWVIIATYWPVIAAAAGISGHVKGYVEFAFAAAQSVTALILILFPDWQRKILTLPMFGAFGVSALLLFGASTAAFGYICAASLMGVFTGSAFLFSVYHCMVDDDNASRRVAINEMMVGLAYVLGPAVAALLHVEGVPFSYSLNLAAGMIAGMVAVQTLTAFWISRKNGQPSVEAASDSEARP